MMVRCVCDYNWASLIILATLFLGTHQKRLSSRSALLQELLSEYGPTSVRPVYNATKTTTVEFRLLITQLIELNEKYQTIQISGWLTQLWQDEFLTWDPAQNDNVTTLFVHTSNIWLPDTTLYKNVDTKFESYKDIPARVNSTGQVKWSSPVILKCTCRIDARHFPFDIQVCELRFSSWAYDDSELSLVQAQEMTALQDHYRDDGVWELLKIEVVRREVTYPCCLAPYPQLSYFVHLKRRPLFHVLNILIPCVLLSILNLLVFALPPESGEKIQLGMTNLLALVLFQQLISDALPPTAAESPRIGFYFTPMIVIGCTSVMCTVFVLKLFYHNDRRPIPTWLRKLILRTAVILFYRLQSHSKPGNRHGSESMGQSGTRLERNSDSSLMENSETAEENNFTEAEVGKNGCSHCRMRARQIGPSYNLSVENPLPADGLRRRGTMKSSRKLTSKEVILDWKDVALVIDRAAMILSALVTTCALVTTVVLLAVGV